MALTDQQLIDSGVRTGLIDNTKLEQLRIEARKQRLPLLNLVIAEHRFPKSALFRAVAEDRGIEFINLTHATIADDILKKIPVTLVRRKQLLPVVSNGSEKLVVADPQDRASIDSIFRLIGHSLPLLMTDQQSMQYKIEQVIPDNHKTQATDGETDLIALLDTI